MHGVLAELKCSRSLSKLLLSEKRSESLSNDCLSFFDKCCAEEGNGMSIRLDNDHHVFEYLITSF